MQLQELGLTDVLNFLKKEIEAAAIFFLSLWVALTLMLMAAAMLVVSVFLNVAFWASGAKFSIRRKGKLIGHIRWFTFKRI